MERKHANHPHAQSAHKKQEGMAEAAAEESVARKVAARPEAWRFYRETLGGARFFLAPMAGYSVLAFRLLCKRHGTDVGVCPMINSGVFVRQDCGGYRCTAYETCAEDQPSIAQICGHDPDAMVQTAQQLGREGRCAAVDVNLGCPQRVAKRGAYGAYLAEQPALVRTIVERLCREARVPITCKMRVADTDEATVAFARMLVDAGCVMLTVHGRTKAQSDLKSTAADWSRIARVVFVAVSLPPQATLALFAVMLCSCFCGVVCAGKAWTSRSLRTAASSRWTMRCAAWP